MSISKMQMNLFKKQKQTQRHQKQTQSTRVPKGGVQDKLGVWDWHIFTTIYKVGNQQGIVCMYVHHCVHCVYIYVHHFPGGAGAKESARQCRRSGRSPRAGSGSWLQYTCLENSMERGAWQATVHGAAQSWTPLSTHVYIYAYICVYD